MWHKRRQRRELAADLDYLVGIWEIAAGRIRDSRKQEGMEGFLKAVPESFEELRSWIPVWASIGAGDRYYGDDFVHATERMLPMEVWGALSGCQSFSYDQPPHPKEVRVAKAKLEFLASFPVDSVTRHELGVAINAEAVARVLLGAEKAFGIEIEQPVSEAVEAKGECFHPDCPHCHGQAVT